MNYEYAYDDVAKEYFAITVVMVIRNRDRVRFEKCLHSLLEQTHECKVIVIDYGSDKENIEWEREAIAKFSNAKLIEVTRNTKDFNKCRALNIGFKEVSTKYLLYHFHNQ